MISAQKLTKYYGLKAAVKDISFQINKGEIVGLLGPNGAGKTTILRMLTCYMVPTDGKILIDGLDSDKQSVHVRKKTGFLPESVPLYNELSVSRFLDFAGSIKGLKGKMLKGEIERVSNTCGLMGNKKKLIKHLSKGFKQRVGLAQALINDPPILILDEPTSGLDPAQIIEIRELIRNLGIERTILLSSHILPEVSQICQRVIIINKGSIVAEDSPERLAEQIQAREGFQTVLRIEGPADEIERELISINGVSKVSSKETGKFLVKSIMDENIRPLIARTIVESGWGLKEMTSKDFSLEDVFVQLVTEEMRGNEE
ncbi:ABC transporter ATP-binding protein [Thermodesulfobacteriota bacterium]